MIHKKSAAIILYNAKNEILLQKRSENAPYQPKKWGLFGGGIKENEKKLNAVKRECFEELKYRLKKPLLIFKGQIRENIYMCVFTEKYDENQKLILQEGEKMEWYSFSQISSLDMIEHDKQIVLDYWNYEKSINR